MKIELFSIVVWLVGWIGDGFEIRGSVLQINLTGILLPFLTLSLDSLTNTTPSQTSPPSIPPEWTQTPSSNTSQIKREKGEGGRSWGRGRVPRRTGRRSRCCGFAEVLGFSRAALQETSIGFRDFKMTTWSFQTSLTKWDPVTRCGSWDIDWNVLKMAGFRQKAALKGLFCERC